MRFEISNHASAELSVGTRITWYHTEYKEYFEGTIVAFTSGRRPIRIQVPGKHRLRSIASKSITEVHND